MTPRQGLFTPQDREKLAAACDDLAAELKQGQLLGPERIPPPLQDPTKRPQLLALTDPLPKVFERAGLSWKQYRNHALGFEMHEAQIARRTGNSPRSSDILLPAAPAFAKVRLAHEVHGYKYRSKAVIPHLQRWADALRKEAGQ